MSLAIARISKKLNLSDSLAGATLLALANGITDLITVIIASLSGEGDNNDLAIGSLFGANFFTCSVVLGATILASKSSQITNINKGNAINDLVFFIIGISVFILMGSLNTYMIWTGVCLLAIYVVYLLLLVRKDHHIKKNKTIEEIEMEEKHNASVHFKVHHDGESVIQVKNRYWKKMLIC